MLLTRTEKWYQNGGSVTFTLPARTTSILTATEKPTWATHLFSSKWKSADLRGNHGPAIGVCFLLQRSEDIPEASLSSGRGLMISVDVFEQPTENLLYVFNNLVKLLQGI